MNLSYLLVFVTLTVLVCKFAEKKDQEIILIIATCMVLSWKAHLLLLSAKEELPGKKYTKKLKYKIFIKYKRNIVVWVFNNCLGRRKAIIEKSFKSFDSRSSSLNYSISGSYATSVIRENFSLPFNVWQNQQSSEKCQVIRDFGSECTKLLLYMSLVQSQ